MKSLPVSKFRTFILILTLALITGGIGYRLGERKTTLSLSPSKIIINQEVPSGNIDFSLFWDVWQRLKMYHIDASKMDAQKMVYGAISGMVNALDDPYTVFLPPKENKEFKDDIGGSFQGIGAQLGTKDNRIIVIAPLKGTPAEKAGIVPQDWIIKVDGEETYGWSVQQAVTKIRGQKGTSVTLSILHNNAEKPIDMTITRDEILVPSVESWIKTPQEISEIQGIAGIATLLPSSKKIAYISLSRFGDRTNEEWLQAVSTITNAMKTNGSITGLVFDLRNNPGGYLDGAVFIASEFIKDGIVVTQINSDGSKQEYHVDRKGKLLDIPIVVLINKGSASASEIVAGALKDHKRATIIGETSYGKGSVQTPQELDKGAGLHITTGKWVTPKGSWIHKIGIAPDIEVSLDESPSASHDAQLAKAIQFLLQ